MLAKGRNLFLDIPENFYKEKGMFDERVTYFSSSAMHGPKGPEVLRMHTEERTIGLGWMLYGFIRMIQPKVIVEVGSGGSSLALLWGLRHNKLGELHTIDPFLWGEDWMCNDNVVRKSSYVTFYDAIEKLEFHDICHQYHDDSKIVGEGWNTEIDMLVVDGDHGDVAVKNDFELFMPWLRKGGYAFFHDLIPCWTSIGEFLQSKCTAKSEYGMLVEPDYLTMGIIQKKFTVNFDGVREIYSYANIDNPDRETTLRHLTDVRGNRDLVLGDWKGKWFPSIGK